MLYDKKCQYTKKIFINKEKHAKEKSTRAGMQKKG